MANFILCGGFDSMNVIFREMLKYERIHSLRREWFAGKRAAASNIATSFNGSRGSSGSSSRFQRKSVTVNSISSSGVPANSSNSVPATQGAALGSTFAAISTNSRAPVATGSPFNDVESYIRRGKNTFLEIVGMERSL
ncbi:hypothetical protein QAD02_012966 [Eretmocerus hayati]|uniref:Uncharacterized protein n=1 Tax=Eretmocerus hayati TaxID=131215 RepID=A0ACC2P3R4_9HYME|nr:hypothetical protein QAD02_012966 [Eretmocerus hayati]